MSSANALLPAFFLSDDLDAIRGAAAALGELSSGRVQKPEGMNPRTGKPERDGLFCARIFGPVEDHRCYCGKLGTPASAGQICDKCGVLCAESRLRGERWGHVESPVTLLYRGLPLSAVPVTPAAWRG